MNKRNALASGLLAACLLGGATGAYAGPLTFSATSTSASGSPVAARASFAIQGSHLILSLDNTSTHDVRVPSDILQAVYWNMAQDISLSLVSATTSSECHFDSSPVICTAGDTYYSGSDLTGKYAYSSNPTGIGSAGLGAFGGTQGMAWGLLSAGDNLKTYNGGMTKPQHNPFVKSQTQFTLDISKNNASYSPSAPGDLGIKDVQFNYGTSKYLVPATVPAPGTLALIPLAVGLMAWVRRRQRSPEG